ncbi:MAG: exo-alpha-sialidase [Planctomycetota bacterium]
MITNRYDPGAERPKLATERVFLYRPEREWTYSHHPHITCFKGRFFAIFSNGRKDEDAPGQRVMLSSSGNFSQWAKPVPLVDSLPGKHGGDLVLTAAGFHQHEGELVAYFGQYQYDKSETSLRAVTSSDGENWSPIRDIGIPVNPNHGPQGTASGRLVISGNISFPYTDDPSGLTGWKMTGIYPSDLACISDNPATFWLVQESMGWPAALCEGSFYQTDDGVIHMLLRSTGEGFRGRLWVTESEDNGDTWSAPRETKFTDNDAKFHFGRLPDGRFYYVGCPDPRPPWTRSPLVLSVSQDGAIFDEHYLLADEPYEMKREGLAKTGQYGYPHTMIHDGFLYVIVSRLKEAVEVIRASIDQF